MLKPAIHFGGELEPGTEVAARYGRAAAALHSLGIGKGDVVALILHNEPLLVELMLAARHLGARWCLINWHFKASEVRHILQDSGAKVLILHADLLGGMRDGIPPGLRTFVAWPHARTLEAFGIRDVDLPRDPLPESWASYCDMPRAAAEAAASPGGAMLYTSGTSGRPKGILRNPSTAEQDAALMEGWRIAFGIEPGMRALVSAPLYHSGPAAFLNLAALNDAELFIEPRFDAEATLRLIESERITHLYLVPTMYMRLLRLAPEVRVRHDLSSVQFVASTGSACAPEVKRCLIEWWGPVFHETYAASELGLITHADSQEALRKPGSSGRALPGVSLRIVGDDGQALPPGQIGSIYARVAAMPDFTYHDNGEARRDLELDGLWTLGDMGYLDEEGSLFVVDRKADMVISGGVNIYPAEIEAELIQMPGIADCAVFGVPDDEYGETVLAAVQVSDGTLTAEQVQIWLRDRVANFKMPRRIVFHDQLPREETGKIFKRRLRAPYWEHHERKI